MYFKEAWLYNFRNYREEHVEFDRYINLFLGENAQGKTNLLEALYVMGLGRSFRTSKDADMICFGESFARIKTTVCDSAEQEEKQIEIVYQSDGKIIRIDGVKLDRSAQLLEQVYIVVFSPEDLRIIKEGPEQRRRFLDWELCQIKPMYYHTLGQYRRTIRQRNALLREGAVDKSLLATYDEVMIEHGLRLTQDRAAFVHRLEGISARIHGAISDGTEHIDVGYEGDFLNEDGSVYTTEDAEAALLSRREVDCFRGYTTIGPHRDDLSIFINGVDSRQFGSQGQQRTAALSMKLAELQLIYEETGKHAILLLDDVLSELDEKRQRFLIEAMQDVQVFITATGIDETILNRLPNGRLFEIEGGKVKKLT